MQPRDALMMPEPFTVLMGWRRGINAMVQPLEAALRSDHERALEALSVCARTLGRPPSLIDYERWRGDRAFQRRGELADPLDEFPSSVLISQLFGSWSVAVETAAVYPGVPMRYQTQGRL